MLLTKLKVASWAVGVVLLVGVGAVGFTYRARAQDSPSRGQQYKLAAQEPVLAAQQKTRAAPDDLESLRLEIEALRKEVRAMSARLKAVEGKAQGQGGGPSTYTPGQKKTKTSNKAADPKPTYYRAKEKAAPTAKVPADPLAELEDAVKRLRQDPTDRKAAEALDRALRLLKERKVPDGATEKRPAK